jgi:hypothetical protein
MPHLSWNAVCDRTIALPARPPALAPSAQTSRPSGTNVFGVFGVRRASVASFEVNVRNLEGNIGSVNLLWRGQLLVEHKSFGGGLAPCELLLTESCQSLIAFFHAHASPSADGRVTPTGGVHLCRC